MQCPITNMMNDALRRAVEYEAKAKTDIRMAQYWKDQAALAFDVAVKAEALLIKRQKA